MPAEDSYVPQRQQPPALQRRQAVVAHAPTASPASPAHPTISLNTILFEFDSAQLKPESIATLRNLGAALNEGLKDQKTFVIEGHTDATGDGAYNMDLSRKRADAVKDFLVNEMGVSADRLQTVGKGATDLANAGDPGGPENRRVVVVNPGA